MFVNWNVLFLNSPEPKSGVCMDLPYPQNGRASYILAVFSDYALFHDKG